jgi:hypothetical protein
MSKRGLGTITTLLDLTDRDAQENDIYPLETTTTWFSRDRSRTTIPFSPQIQTLLFRGPAAFGQRFVFDIGSIQCGDIIFGAALQIKLRHWLDASTLLQLEAGDLRYADVATAWEYANSLGSSIIEKAELEVDGKTLETIDGDFISVCSLLFPDYNTQFGIAYDHLGRLSVPALRALTAPRAYPTENGVIHCPLAFFFGRVRYQEALPLISIKEGLCRIIITLRPFSEVVRQMRGYKDTCDATPLGTTANFVDRVGSPARSAVAQATIPSLESVALVTHGAVLDGEVRNTMLRKPWEMIYRELQTFYFDEPLKYSVRSQSDKITIQLPLEANHPVEEILWIIRRKDVALNNEWANYTGTLEKDRTAASVLRPLLVSAKIQVNGITLIEADEQYFRHHIASKHAGGYAAYSNYIYGISFAEKPGEHDPTGSINASRANSLRLTLEIQPPTGTDSALWEVKVFCLGINWMRYENGLAGPLFED